MSRLTERALPLPEGLSEVEGVDNIELARIWWQEGMPRMIIRPMLADRKLVGTMLAQLAYHFSQAYEERTGQPQPEALKEIQQGWAEAHARVGGGKEGAE